MNSRRRHHPGMASGKLIPGLLLVAVCLLGSAVFHSLCLGAEKQKIESSLEKKRRQLEEGERKLQRLTQEERALHADMAEIADRIDVLEIKLEEELKALVSVEQQEDQIQRQLADLIDDKKQSLENLADLIHVLWPMRMQRLTLQGRDAEFWEKADREFVWTGEIYDKLEQQFVELKEKQTAVSRALAERQELSSEIRTHMAAVDRTKTQLLEDKLQFMRRLGEIRREKADLESELKRIVATVEDLNYTLHRLPEKEEVKTFASLRGNLPSPVQGKIIAGYDPAGTPPVRGVGFSASQQAKVRAVAGGKVVHNDVLRGFGRVVVLMHGKDYYTLYAFMAESSYQVGTSVAAGEVLGTTGFYPRADGPGLYFELRFHQKAINPMKWLSAQK